MIVFYKNGVHVSVSIHQQLFVQVRTAEDKNRRRKLCASPRGHGTSLLTREQAVELYAELGAALRRVGAIQEPHASEGASEEEPGTP